MNDKYGRFSFCPDNYKGVSKYLEPNEIDEDRMFDDIRDVIRVGLRNGYQFRVSSDEYCVMLDYNYRDPEMAGATLEWIGENEYVGSFDDDPDLREPFEDEA